MTSDDWVLGRTNGQLVMVYIDKLAEVERERDEARALADVLLETANLTGAARDAAEQDAARLAAVLMDEGKECLSCRGYDVTHVCLERADRKRAALAAHEERVKGGAP